MEQVARKPGPSPSRPGTQHSPSHSALPQAGGPCSFCEGPCSPDLGAQLGGSDPNALSTWGLGLRSGLRTRNPSCLRCHPLSLKWAPQTWPGKRLPPPFPAHPAASAPGLPRPPHTEEACPLWRPVSSLSVHLSPYLPGTKEAGRRPAGPASTSLLLRLLAEPSPAPVRLSCGASRSGGRPGPPGTSARL